MKTIILAAGCFWSVQYKLSNVEGVLSTKAVYANGIVAEATYTQVCSGTTGHAEAVRITYDPAKVSYGDLLHIFFSVVADPTTLNYQGPDHGPQYRSAIFATSGEQADVATAYIAQLAAADAFRAPIVTAVEKATKFYPAEDYHQAYWDGEGQRNPYCLAVIPPKLMKLRKSFQKYVKD